MNMIGRGGKTACLVAGLAMTLGVAEMARADEGMWPYDHAPVEQIRQAYGFAPSQAWLDHLRLASVDPGASAAFVSPDGLILTNHHVALSSVQRVSTPEHNYVQNGFFAATREQEIPLPGNTLKVLVSIEEVSARVTAGVKPNLNPAQARVAREAAITVIEAECLKQTGLKGEVVALYGGAHHDLYRYKEYTDVRLVFVPELQAAFFGGDWDNFCYPRWDLDIAFLRAYENGRPARVEHWLQVNPAGTRDGDMVFVSGNPGRTQRLKTLANLEYSRDLTYPERLARTQHQREVLRRYMALGEEQARRARTFDYFYGNTLKRVEGELAGLREPRLMANKVTDEQALRAAVAADEQLEARYGGAWERVAAAYAWAAAHDADRLYRSEMPGGRFFGTALGLVRLQAETGKADVDRLPGYHESELPDLLRRLGRPAPVYKDMEEVMATDAFQRLRDGLGAEELFVQAVLQGRTPAEAATFYLQGTRLDDVAVRRELAKDNGKAVPGSDDVLLALARRLDPLLREAEKAFRENVRAVEESAETDIAQARFAVYGDKVYPDATGTLRLGFGRVAGYPSATTLVPPFTTWYGLYDRAFSFGDQGDFALTANQRARRDRLDLGGVLDLACTVDITGGNSGSPIVDRDGRLVGVAFDGNQTSHANQFVYDETEARCIGVDVRGILQALGKLYDAQPLVDELLAGAR
jgi:hypothetical protein